MIPHTNIKCAAFLALALHFSSAPPAAYFLLPPPPQARREQQPQLQRAQPAHKLFDASWRAGQRYCVAQVFFDISIGGVASGRVSIGLFGGVVPKVPAPFATPQLSE
jgi:hypothetical protein